MKRLRRGRAPWFKSARGNRAGRKLGSGGVEEVHERCGVDAGREFDRLRQGHIERLLLWDGNFRFCCAENGRRAGAGKLALISGGWQRFTKPMHIGFVGYGMLDAACPRKTCFSRAQTPEQMLASG